MPTYEEPATDYEFGDSGTWNSGQTSVPVQYNADGGLAFCKFEGLTDILAGVSLTSATLHLSFDLPSGTAVVQVYGVKTDPPTLPGGWSTAWTIWQDYKSSLHPNFDADGLTTKDLNITSLIEELMNDTEGDDIVLLFTQDPSYSGAAVTTLTATLEINFTGDTAEVEVDAPEAIIELEAAAMSAEVHVNVTQPEAVIELEAATMSAITPVLVSQAEALIEIEASTPSAITNLAVTAPETLIEIEAATIEAETSVVATLPEAFIELDAGAMTAITPVLVTAPEALIELEASTPNAATVVLASQPEAIIELEAAALTGRPDIAVTAPAATIEIEVGRLYTPATWKTVKALQPKASAVTAK